MNKRAQSISINTIVVAAIALIVLVVIIAIFSGRIKIFTGGARDCRTQGGECAADCLEYGEENGGTYINMPGTNCEDNKGDDAERYCCVPIIKAQPEEDDR